MIPPRIAIVHSDASVSGLLVTLLEEDGFQPLSVSNFENAIDTIRRDLPALVIIDFGYGPSHPGWTLAEHLRADSLTDRIPIVGLTTAFDSISEPPAGCQARCEVLSSPFDINLVIGAIRSLLKSPHHCHCP